MNATELKQLQADRLATLRDHERLQMIVENLAKFIKESHGEDRSGLQMDLFKYKTLYSQAGELLTRINQRLQTKK